MTLTKREKVVYRFLLDYTIFNHRQPTTSRVAKAFEVSQSTVRRWYKALIHKGFLTRDVDKHGDVRGGSLKFVGVVLVSKDESECFDV